MIYLDHNATTPCDPEVLDAMLPYFLQKFGNAASRTHSFGWVAEEGVEKARGQVAALLSAEPEEIVFTSGATEACNLAIKGIWERYAIKGNHIISCVAEHKAVLDTCAYLEKKGAEVDYLPVNAEGLIDLRLLESKIRPTTVLIAIMFANNETGVIQPVAEIGQIARKNNVLFFTDATQAIGKIPVNVQDHSIDVLALSAHKLYGPKGVGALFVRRKSPRVSLISQMHGGGHERTFRSGTLNVPGIVGLGMACALSAKRMHDDGVRLGFWRDRMEEGWVANGYLGKINGHRQCRLSHVSNISFVGVRAERLIARLSQKIAFSVGSACTSASQQASHVLTAMGLNEQELKGALRISMGRCNTEADIKTAIAEINGALMAERQRIGGI